MPRGKSKDGLTKTQFYRTWYKMINRCANPKWRNYKYYGGRGITVSQDWLSYDNFENDMIDTFADHVEDFGFGHNTSIERINNDGGYFKENCKWATQQEQCKNRGGQFALKL